MRLVLLPITTNRTLLYCIRTNQSTPGRVGLADRVSARVAGIWAGWERRESGWQRKIVDYGNHALRRIPYQEWGLKSVPPLSRRRRADELGGKEPVELAFPGSVIAPGEAAGILRRLGTEREALHRMRLIWCCVGMPLTAPVALLPIIPNIPFFYLAYRAWSHWRAIKGSQHVQFLTKCNLLTVSPSPVLDAIYATPTLPATEPPPDAAADDPQPEDPEKPASNPEDPAESEGPDPGEKVLLTPEIGTRLSEALEHPEIEVEIERALWQIEHEKSAQKSARDGGSAKG